MCKEIHNVEIMHTVAHQEPASVGLHTKTLCEFQTKILCSVKFIFFLEIEQRARIVVVVFFGEENQPMGLVFGHALSGRRVPRRTYRFCSLEISKAEAFEDRKHEIKRKLGPGFGCISWSETFMRIRVMLLLYLHIETNVTDDASGFIWAIKHSLFNPVSHVFCFGFAEK